MLIDAKPDIFFTEPHYNGYPAVLVWLPKIELALLEEMIHESWHLQAPRRLAKAYDETAGRQLSEGAIRQDADKPVGDRTEFIRPRSQGV